MSQMSPEMSEKITTLVTGKAPASLIAKVEEAIGADFDFWDEADAAPFKEAVALLYAQAGVMPGRVEAVGCYLFWRAGRWQAREAARAKVLAALPEMVDMVCAGSGMVALEDVRRILEAAI